MNKLIYFWKSNIENEGKNNYSLCPNKCEFNGYDNEFKKISTETSIQIVNNITNYIQKNKQKVIENTIVK